MRQLSILFPSLAIMGALAGAVAIRHDISIDDIVLLARAGFPDGVIIQALDLSGFDDHASADIIGKLRSAGIQDRVLEFFLRNSRQAQHIKLLDPGIYRKRGEEYVRVDEELATWRSTAKVASESINSITRVKISARLEEAKSLLRLNERAELLIVSDRERSASEYQLFRSATKEGWRGIDGEIALLAGNLLGSGGYDGLSLTTLLDHSFDLGVRVPLRMLGRGEYVLVPPGLIASGQVASTSEVYTFGID